MRNSNIQICNEIIHPGEFLSLALPLPELFGCAPMYLPIKILQGKQSGPCLLIIAAMHGNELNGTEIINRLLKNKAVQKLHGTLILIPVINVYGLINRLSTLPSTFDLEKSFPGSENGTHTGRIAHIFCKEIFSKADYCIDLQTGFFNHSNFPSIHVDFDDLNAKELAEAYNSPVITRLKPEKGTLAAYAFENKIPYILYKAGEALRFDEVAIRSGLRGVLNVMRKIKMLPLRNPQKSAVLKSFIADKNIWVRSSMSGINHSTLKLGQYVKAGDVLCEIKDPFGVGDDLTIEAPEDSIIVGKNNIPLVYEGEGVFQLGVFSKMQQAASHLEEWKEKTVEQFNEERSNS
ncbi:MAG: succinylglutamate desuccinylase/aspartoacylase family protein [Bacteroidales bacterium]